MAVSLFNPAFKSSVNQKFREKRFAFFLSLLKTISGRPIRILDIGGTEAFWVSMNFQDSNVQVTLLNLSKEPTTRENFSSVVGDACNLAEFKDGEFDIVFSNSVIEHLFTWENQQKMAREVQRVGKNYYVQTPNYWFPIEPHWVFPFFQYFPFTLRVFLTRHFNLGHYPKAADDHAALERVREVRLLTQLEMKRLFPGAKVFLEKFMGLNKSITMHSFRP